MSAWLVLLLINASSQNSGDQLRLGFFWRSRSRYITYSRSENTLYAVSCNGDGCALIANPIIIFVSFLSQGIMILIITNNIID